MALKNLNKEKTTKMEKQFRFVAIRNKNLIISCCFSRQMPIYIFYALLYILTFFFNDYKSEKVAEK